MEIAVVSTSPAVLQAEIVVDPIFLRHVCILRYFGHKAASDSLTVNALENMDIAVGILFVGVVGVLSR